MKKAGINRIFYVTVALILLCNQYSYAQEVKNGLTWYTDINEVYKIAEKTKKPIFAFFTGSDWCGWCHKLESAVLTKPGFIAWAKKNVVLLELDYPRNKELPEKLKKQNEGLQQFFQVQGFPTIWIFNMTHDKTTGKFNIAALGSLGYPQAERGKEETAFLENANTILKNKK